MQIVDRRPGTPNALPVARGRRWRSRRFDDIKGVCVHHTAGGSDPAKTAQYHINPNHVSPRGMPAIGYTFYITEKEIVLCNDLSAVTWSQGGKTVPDLNRDGKITREDGLNRANKTYLGIVVGGNFDSEWNETNKDPSPRQIAMLLVLLDHLFGIRRIQDDDSLLFGVLSHVGWDAVFTHRDFGKIACPGELLYSLLTRMRETAVANLEEEVYPKALTCVKDWQKALLALGYELPKWGVDGDWGDESSDALRFFQMKEGLKGNGKRTKISEHHLLIALEEAGIV